jgi:hypothetical protein
MPRNSDVKVTSVGSPERVQEPQIMFDGVPT